jgi:AraC-like DNA-binding protein
MRRLVISTDDVPEAERFSYWREVVGGLVGVSGERNKDQETSFSGQFVGSVSDSFLRMRVRCDAFPVCRGPREIAHRSWDDHVMVLRESSVGSWYTYNRREVVLRPGDLVAADPTFPLVGKARASWDHETWLFPRRLIEPHLSASRPQPFVLAGREGLAGVVKAYLDAIAAQMDALDEREAELVADNFCQLLAVACGAAAGEHQQAIRLARLEEAKRYIGLHLADPEMTPEKTAAALKMSVRQLHLVFEPSGTSFAQYVLKRRLAECRAALLSPVGARSVTDIALGFGFNSLWTFNRTFRRAFGATPSEMRGAAAGPRSTG